MAKVAICNYRLTRLFLNDLPQTLERQYRRRLRFPKPKKKRLEKKRRGGRNQRHGQIDCSDERLPLSRCSYFGELGTIIVQHGCTFAHRPLHPNPCQLRNLYSVQSLSSITFRSTLCCFLLRVRRSFFIVAKFLSPSLTGEFLAVSIGQDLRSLVNHTRWQQDHYHQMLAKEHPRSRNRNQPLKNRSYKMRLKSRTCLRTQCLVPAAHQLGFSQHAGLVDLDGHPGPLVFSVCNKRWPHGSCDLGQIQLAREWRKDLHILGRVPLSAVAGSRVMA